MSLVFLTITDVGLHELTCILIISSRRVTEKISNQKMLIFPPHLTSSSPLPREKGNREIASFHLNAARGRRLTVIITDFPPSIKTHLFQLSYPHLIFDRLTGIVMVILVVMFVI